MHAQGTSNLQDSEQAQSEQAQSAPIETVPQ